MLRFYFFPIICLITLSSFSQSNYTVRNVDRIVNLKGYWKFSIGDNSTWKGTTINDEDWQEIYAPSAWEDEGFHGYDGFAWYRKKFLLPEGAPNQDLFFNLGYIDDVDEVFVNGKKIGGSGTFPPNFTTSFSSLRIYRIPDFLLHSDQPNTIAVRVYDTVLGGGLISGDLGIFRYKTSGLTQNLEGIWKIKNSVNSEFRKNTFDDSQWQEIVVPGFTGNLKDKTMGSHFTYRYTFQINERLFDADETLILVLGKIDDFDRTYLNGQLIGMTKDNGYLGSSASWSQFRIYALPRVYLIPGGTNVLTVEVEDLGKNAGIYTGPILICTESEYERILRRFD